MDGIRHVALAACMSCKMNKQAIQLRNRMIGLRIFGGAEHAWVCAIAMQSEVAD